MCSSDLQTDKRVAAMCRDGITTLEVKSGYGLDKETELRSLRVARALPKRHPITVRATYLGLHALAPEWNGDADAYVDFVCRDVLPAIVNEGLADTVDAFCETIAFTPQQTSRFFDAAKAFGLPVKLHADQLTDCGGTSLAARYRALSADHLEHAREADLAALADAGTVAVLLPGAYYFLHDSNPPPIEALEAAGVPIALASDCNPGTSPLVSPLLAMNLACTLWRMTPAQALRGMTANAARALGLAGTRGTLRVGEKADFVVWDVPHPAHLAYAIGFNPGATVVQNGRSTTEN